MRKKLSHLGETATGKRAAVLKGRAKAGLAEVYAAAHLPSVTTPQPLPRGDRRMLEERKRMDFVAELKSLYIATAQCQTNRQACQRQAAHQGGK